jgi:hypothetical protein
LQKAEFLERFCKSGGRKKKKKKKKTERLLKKTSVVVTMARKGRYMYLAAKEPTVTKQTM